MSTAETAMAILDELKVISDISYHMVSSQLTIAVGVFFLVGIFLAWGLSWWKW